MRLDVHRTDVIRRQLNATERPEKRALEPNRVARLVLLIRSFQVRFLAVALLERAANAAVFVWQDTRLVSSAGGTCRR
jgi:hypothetical protein